MNFSKSSFSLFLILAASACPNAFAKEQLRGGRGLNPGVGQGASNGQGANPQEDPDFPGVTSDDVRNFRNKNSLKPDAPLRLQQVVPGRGVEIAGEIVKVEDDDCLPPDVATETASYTIEDEVIDTPTRGRYACVVDRPGVWAGVLHDGQGNIKEVQGYDKISGENIGLSMIRNNVLAEIRDEDFDPAAVADFARGMVADAAPAEEDDEEVSGQA